MKAVLRDAWRLTGPYFMRSEERWSARFLFAVIIVMNLVSVGIDVVLNYWHGAFYDALQQKDFSGFLALILSWRDDTEHGFMLGFLPIVTFAVILGVYTTYLTQLLQIRWRRWMTEHTLADWLAGRAYYTIPLQAPAAGVRPTDNPDQRISQDLNDFTTDTLSLGFDLLSNVVSLVSFAQILWVLSGATAIFGVTIPGYMLWLALVYAVVGTWLTHLVGRPLALLEFLRQKVEADFRFGLVRVRENAEGIALYGGEQPERAGLLGRFGAVVLNWRAVMNRRKKLNAMSLGYRQAAVIFPFIIAAPRYFTGAIELGGLMRVAGAFGQVQSSLSWFVVSYADLARWRATVDRLISFQNAIETAHAMAGSGATLRPGKPGAVTLDDVTIGLPDGRTLLDHASLSVRQGRSTVISGRSGAGKSTLFRTLAGIWPFGQGSVQRPPGTSLFLPQRPYIPLGTLRTAICYPADPATTPDAAIQEALAAVGLASLSSELDTEQAWTQRLSGGEQQRLAVARALLLRPDWLYLDEATASLDPDGEAELYRTLREKLPGTTIISIAHRAEVSAWHEDALVFGEKRLAPATVPAAAAD